MAFERDIIIRSKHTPWGGAIGNGDVVLLGRDWSGAAFRWTFGTPGGSAIITLSNAAAGSEGVSATWNPEYIHPITRKLVGATIIRGQIDEATLEGLTWGPAASDPLVTSHDLLVTPSGDPQRPLMFGKATIYPGVGD